MQITFRPDGTAQHIGDSTLLAGSVASATKRRASSIEPANVALRAAFHAVRACCLDDSRLAAWTRTWACQWRVRIHGGPVLAGTFTDRAEAIRAEIAWLQENRL